MSVYVYVNIVGISIMIDKKYTNVYIYIYIGVCLWSRRPGFNPRVNHIKDSKKWFMMPPCLTHSIIRYGSGVSEAIQGKKSCPPNTSV